MIIIMAAVAVFETHMDTNAVITKNPSKMWAGF
jgi:hypothetical protein